MALPPTRASGPFRPTRLGQWEVIAKIAGGGMSAVYLGRRVAVDLEPDSPKVVALKIVRHDVRWDDRLLKMFLEEGKLIAKLVHPNITRTLEVGGDGEQEFIAMELMLGKTFAPIHDTLATRDVRLNPEIGAWVAARVADALHYAHELADEHGQPLGLVHRDVNPANVFATFNGEVKLFDFGLAKVTAGDISGSQLLAGKLSYLSPEQIMQMPLDRRSDVFSLGTTLWELLTGKRLFRRDSDLETVRAVQLGPIPDPRAVAPEIPEELARITRTALERNREHRYPTAAYLARELDAFVFTRTSPNDVTARLATLVDTLFPGEQKRQSGWLKPAITSSISRPSGAPPSMRPSYVPSSGPRSITPREITAVMPGAPPKPGMPDPTGTTSSSPSSSAPSRRSSIAPPTPNAAPTSARGSARGNSVVPKAPDSMDALDALEQMEMTATAVKAPDAPSYEDVPLFSINEPSPSAIPGPPTSRDAPPPFTPREGAASVRPEALLPTAPAPAPAPASISPGSASGRAAWPLSSNRATPSVPPPPQRSRAPGPRPSVAPPPAAAASTNESPSTTPPNSRTDVAVPIVTATGGPSESVSPKEPKRGSIPPPKQQPSPSIPPKASPSLAPGPMSVRARLPRKPIPLPSSSRKVVEAARSSSRITEPPDSDTQVDVPAPPIPPNRKGP